MTEIEVGGDRYRLGKLPPLKQFHIVRRAAALLGGLEFQSGQAIDFARIKIKPIVEALAGMSDQDAEYILFGLLSVCQKALPGGTGWANLISAGGQLMYQDLTLPQLMRFAQISFNENLADFFPAGLSTSSVEGPTQNTQ
ncbi:MAG: phage tail assembly chaperone [Burkholderiales bacterium]